MAKGQFMTLDRYGKPYGSSWAGMSMGEGRKVEGDLTNPCLGSPDKPKSPDGRHHYTAVTCVQSVEHFVCDHCDDDWYD
jgi:hypothetical protein